MDFSGYQHPSDIILLAVRYYVSYKLSYRDIEEIFAERGSFVDHSTINRWVINFAPIIESKARQTKRPVSSSWRMDATYIKGEWWYYYRAVDKYGAIIDFYLSETCDEPAARDFFNISMVYLKRSSLIKVGRIPQH